MPGCVGEGLLQNSVGGLVDGAVEPPGLSVARDAHVQPRRGVASDEGVERREPGGASATPFSAPRSAACRRSGRSRDGLAGQLLDRFQRCLQALGILAQPAVPARTAITLMACPAASWRSRAIRARSSAAARRRSRSASRSARSARSLKLGELLAPEPRSSPANQAAPQASPVWKSSLAGSRRRRGRSRGTRGRARRRCRCSVASRVVLIATRGEQVERNGGPRSSPIG